MRTRKDPRHTLTSERGALTPTGLRKLTKFLLPAGAAITALIVWSPAFAIPFLHVAGDSDGDHVLDGPDGAPAVYCGTSHADVNSSGGVDAIDIGIVRSEFMNEFPTLPALRDQNHNDAGEMLDVAIVNTYFGRTVAAFCGAAVADPIPPTGVGATAGAELELSAPAAPVGDINPAVFTTGATDPYRGYSAMIHFDETVVNAVSATNVLASATSCSNSGTAIIDNSDDMAGPDGSVILSCFRSTAVATVGTLVTFNFNVIDAGDPAFCIRAFTDGAGGPLRGTFTFGTDLAAQVQMLANTCGLGDPGVDSDSDGCTNSEEAGGDITFGGLRNPLFPYDFYDVNGSEHVNATDIALVRANFDTTPPYPPGDEIYDRSLGAVPANGYAPGAPDGVISGLDIALVRSAAFHDCRPAP